jgi:hypothetical protein
MLAQVMDCLMHDTSYMVDMYSKKILFYANNEELENVYYKDFSSISIRVNIDDKSANKNLEIINKQFNLNLIQTPFQKTR